MTGSEFIFSNKIKHRLARHLTFWMLYYARFVALELTDIKISTLTGSVLYANALQDALRFLPVHLFAVYITIYFILPKYLAKRNIVFLVVSCLLLIIVTISSGYFISILIFGKTTYPYAISLGTRKCASGFIAITSCAVIIKIMKDHFFRQRESEKLATENILNKLRLLKMQLHPNILFECLNSIYIDVDAGTIHAPEMILKLSELLSYLLYEAELKQVPLVKEVKMIQTYLQLKKLEYKSKVNINFEVKGEIDAHYITPVLFLSLLEIAVIPFEKSEKQFSLNIELKGIASTLYFSLKNNAPGIQIMNMPAVQTKLDSIKKRLQIFYSDKFKIEVLPTSNSFAILFELEQNNHLKNYNFPNDDTLIYEHA